jgi:general secretion pathway protein G
MQNSKVKNQSLDPSTSSGQAFARDTNSGTWLTPRFVTDRTRYIQKSKTGERMKGNGYSLMEVLVALAIVAILAAVMLTNYSTTSKKTRDGRRKADLDVIRVALESYKVDVGIYPDGNPPRYEVPSSIIYDDGEGHVSTYLKQAPKDPLYPNSNYYYCYVPAANKQSYKVSAVFETEQSECPGVPTWTPTPTPEGWVPPSGPTMTPTPTPTLTITPTPTIGVPCLPAYGCFNGVCQEIHGPPLCAPNYCYSDCTIGGEFRCQDDEGNPANECIVPP